MKTHATLLLSTLVLSGAALAQTKAPEPDYTLSFNVGAVSDYRYRGLSQTRLKPAVQAGADFAHKSGVYVGLWASTIRWIKDNDVKGPVEVDVYAGYKGSLGDVAYDVGYLRYEYVGNKLENASGYKNANTQELYAAGTVGPVTLKYSRSIGNLFGALSPTGKDTAGSGYLDLSATFDLGNGFALTPHVGRQSVKNYAKASYTDYSLTLAKDMGKGVSLSAMAVSTNASREVYYGKNNAYNGKNGLVLGAKYTF